VRAFSRSRATAAADQDAHVASQRTIRRATLADLDTVLELRLALLAEHYGNPLYRRVRPDVRERAHTMFAAQLEAPSEITLLAHIGAPAVGVLLCIDAAGSPLLFPPRYGYVTSVFVRPAARRSGVLAALYREAERWCLARGLTEMRLHSTPENPLATAAWEALGFRVVEQLRAKEIARD
jgi:ribosomal protein S18 acetylase RimI-like enzyme